MSQKDLGDDSPSGYDCELVDQPKEIQSECPVCLQILCEPHQVTCCGKSYCKECIRRIKDERRPCPTCNASDFVEFPNKGLQQSLYSFKVYCTHRRKGCEWTGELRDLEKHLNVNNPEYSEHLQGCEFVEIGCSFFLSGCQERVLRRDMQKHLTESLVSHTTMLAASNARLVMTVSRLERENHDLNTQLKRVCRQNDQLLGEISELRQLQHHSSPTTYGPVEFTLSNYREYKKGNHNWISPPFYTHSQGYKICLDVALNGNGIGKGTHVSVYAHMMQGEFDDLLKWPFKGVITVQLVSQVEDNDHCTKVIPFHGAYDDSGRVYGKSACDLGRGIPAFISHKEVKPKYLKNNCLSFRILKVEHQ